MRFTVRTTVSAALEEVYRGFGDVDFVTSIPPRFMQLEVHAIGLELGDVIDGEMRLGSRSVRWISEIVSVERGHDEIWFVDRSGAVKPWPLWRWEHHHGFIRRPSGGTVIVDSARFAVRPRVMAPVTYVLMYLSFLARRAPYRRRFGRG